MAKRKFALVFLRLMAGIVLVYGLAVGAGWTAGMFFAKEQQLQTAASPIAEPIVQAEPHSDPAAADHASPAAPIATPAEPKITPSEEPGIKGWASYAIAMPSFRHRDKFIIALIFDDVGVQKARTQTLIDTKAPLTLSFLPYAEQIQRQVRAARANGHEVLLHLPMEAIDVDAHPGPHALMLDMSKEEIEENLRLNLSAFDSYIGVNNHMGSKFTQNADAMRIVLKELKARDLIFVDSLTTADSIAAPMAAAMGILSGKRDVFLDNEDDLEKIRAQFTKLEEIARKKGTAIAIGHPRPKTLQVLQEWLIRNENSEFMVVPLSVVLQERQKRADNNHPE